MARSLHSDPAVPEAPMPTAIVTSGPQSAVFGLLLSLRPSQWTKNLLVFAGLLFAKKLFEPPAVIAAVSIGVIR